MDVDSTYTTPYMPCTSQISELKAAKKKLQADIRQLKKDSVDQQRQKKQLERGIERGTCKQCPKLKRTVSDLQEQLSERENNDEPTHQPTYQTPTPPSTSIRMRGRRRLVATEYIHGEDPDDEVPQGRGAAQLFSIDSIRAMKEVFAPQESKPAASNGTNGHNEDRGSIADSRRERDILHDAVLSQLVTKALAPQPPQPPPPVVEVRKADNHESKDRPAAFTMDQIHGFHDLFYGAPRAKRHKLEI